MFFGVKFGCEYNVSASPSFLQIIFAIRCNLRKFGYFYTQGQNVLTVLVVPNHKCLQKNLATTKRGIISELSYNPDSGPLGPTTLEVVSFLLKHICTDESKGRMQCRPKEQRRKKRKKKPTWARDSKVGTNTAINAVGDAAGHVTGLWRHIWVINVSVQWQVRRHHVD